MGSIRWRILKGRYLQEAIEVARSYSGLDPMEDTESRLRRADGGPAGYGYSGLDPMEDTEREALCRAAYLTRWLQWARSDGGY